MILSLWLSLSFVGAASARSYLIADGMAEGYIYAPDPLRQASAFAIEELGEHIRQMTGVEIKVAWREAGGRDRGIELKVMERDKLAPGVSTQGYTISQDSKRKRVRIVGNSHLGLLYGVYDYLGGLGMRWYTPGAIGTCAPRLDKIEIVDEERAVEPIFRLRNLEMSATVYRHFGDPADPRVADNLDDYVLWLLRNRLHFRRHMVDESRTRFSFNRPPYGGGHALRSVAGLQQFFKDTPAASFERNPERWPMLERDFTLVRTNQGPHQICFTNKDNIRDAIANTVRKLREVEAANTELDEVACVSLALADTIGICRCPECEKMAGDDPNRDDRLIWSFMNSVARGVDAEFPGGKIILFAPYYEMTQPPLDVKIEPNIIALSCRSVPWDADSGQALDDPFPPQYRQWIERTKAAGAEQGVYDYVLMSHCPQPLDILDAFNEYRKLGYKYYQPEVMQRSEQTWSMLWSLAQACWDGERTPREIQDEFCLEYYGREGAEVVLELLGQITANSRRIRRIGYGCTFYSSAMLPDDLIAIGRTALTKAISSAEGVRRERLSRFRDSMDVHFRIAELHRANIAALNYRNDETIASLKRQAEGFMAFWEERRIGDLFSSNILYFPKEILERDYSKLKPLRGGADYNDVDLVHKTLFLGEKPPVLASELFVLPEIWKLKLDSSIEGTSEKWYLPDLDDGTANGWQQVSSWNMIENQGYGDARSIDGHFWYRVSFKAPAFPAGKRLWLRMGGLDDEGTVYLNGRQVSERRMVDGHSWKGAFSVDITDVLKAGTENILAVHGYDSEGGGGVWRPVVIYAR